MPALYDSLCLCLWLWRSPLLSLQPHLITQHLPVTYIIRVKSCHHVHQSWVVQKRIFQQLIRLWADRDDDDLQQTFGWMSFVVPGWTELCFPVHCRGLFIAWVRVTCGELLTVVCVL